MTSQPRPPRQALRHMACADDTAPPADGPDLEMLEFLGEWEDGNGQAVDPEAFTGLDAAETPAATTGEPP